MDRGGVQRVTTRELTETINDMLNWSKRDIRGIKRKLWRGWRILTMHKLSNGLAENKAIRCG